MRGEIIKPETRSNEGRGDALSGARSTIMVSSYPDPTYIIQGQRVRFGKPLVHVDP